MDRRLRTILLVAGALVLLFYLALSWYKFHYSMAVVEGFEVNSPELDQRVLIATQGSRFKDRVVDALVEQLSPRPIYLKVIDISLLSGVDEQAWNALVLLHTWETWRPPLAVKRFVRQMKAPEKVVVVSTSGSGEAQMEGVDAITASSAMTEVSATVETVMARLEPLLSQARAGSVGPARSSE